MKAVVVTKYGQPEVLKLVDLPKPVPAANEVLIKIHATAVNSTDPTFRKGDPFMSRFYFGLSRPKHSILGDVLAGEIEETGGNVTLFKKGDKVYGTSTATMGTYAEYKCLPEDGALALKPENMTYAEAAGLCDGALTAITFLIDAANIQKGQSILIYGASGSVGTAAVQLARLFGAEVTGVCSSVNLEMVKSLGASNVIDYTSEDFTKNGKTYDIIFDTVGKISFSQCKNSLSADGIYMTTVPSLGVLLSKLRMRPKKGKWATFAAAGLAPAKDKAEDLKLLGDYVRLGYLKTVIDREYKLEEMSEAHRYVETGHKKGNVVVNVEHNSF